MVLILHHRKRIEILILLICVVYFSGAKKHIKEDDDSSNQEDETKSTFVTIRIPTNKKECYYEGKAHHHGDVWSPGPCVPECRCKHGYVKCTKIECPDLNCDAPIKKKWKCCPECLPQMQDGTSCGVWTVGGNGNGGCCVFPFNYHGIKYFTCTYQDHGNPWCAISSNFDRDRVWGECIDKGDARYTLRFNRHHGNKANHRLYDEKTDLLSALAQEAANNVTSEAENNPSLPYPNTPLPTYASTSVAGTTAAAVVAVAGAGAPTLSVQLTPSNGSLGVAVPSPGIIAVTSTQLAATPEVATAAQSYLPTPSPSLAVPVVTQVPAPMSGESVAQMTPGSATVGTPLVYYPPPSVVLPAHSVVPTQSTAVATPSLGITYPLGGTPTLVPQPSQVTQSTQPTESGTPGMVTQPQPQPSQVIQSGQLPTEGETPVLVTQPQPLPSQVIQPGQLPTEGGTPVLVTQPQPLPSQVIQPGQLPTEGGTPVLVTQPQPLPSQVIQPGQLPTEGGIQVLVTQPQPQPSQVVQPGQLPTEGGTPPLVTQLVPQPSPVTQPAQSTIESPNLQHPFPVTQTTIDPGQSQAPNQAVHEVTTTELGENHNITTTESWFGSANETLNRTNEVPSAQLNENAGAPSSSSSYYNQPSNQASHDYQAASSTNEYQNQSQSPYTDQSYLQGTTGYNTINNEAADQRYWYSTAQNSDGQVNSYYNNAADQQYQDSQAQNAAGQESYYSSQQQYQNAAYPGTYYSG